MILEGICVICFLFTGNAVLQQCIKIIQAPINYFTRPTTASVPSYITSPSTSPTIVHTTVIPTPGTTIANHVSNTSGLAIINGTPASTAFLSPSTLIVGCIGSYLIINTIITNVHYIICDPDSWVNWSLDQLHDCDMSARGIILEKVTSHIHTRYALEDSTQAHTVALEEIHAERRQLHMLIACARILHRLHATWLFTLHQHDIVLAERGLKILERVEEVLVAQHQARTPSTPE